MSILFLGHGGCGRPGIYIRCYRGSVPPVLFGPGAQEYSEHAYVDCGSRLFPKSYFSITGVSNIQFILYGLIMVLIMLFEPFGALRVLDQNEDLRRTWPSSRLMKNAHPRRYPRSSSLRRTSVYASLLGTSGALHLDVF